MSVFAFITHKNGKAEDSAFELASAAKKAFPNENLVAIVMGSGIQGVCEQVASCYSEVWKIENAGLSYPNAEVIRKILVKILPAKSCVFVAHDTFGMDLAPGLSVKLDGAFLPDVNGLEAAKDGKLQASRQEYGGMISAHVACDISNGVVISTRQGAFQPNPDLKASGEIKDKASDVGSLPEAKRKFLQVIEAEAGDVDITKSEILVSVGRGIEDKDNLEIIFDLAKAMGGDVACSRPIVDSKWLEKSRQVGTSGKTVKPKVYMALGISGSFQHMGGIKGSPFIVAINKNPKAPIFQFAEVGVVANMLEFIPELTEKINDSK